MNLTKYFMTNMQRGRHRGPADFPSIWNLKVRSGKAAGLLLNWSGDTPAMRSVLIDSALGLGAPPQPWFMERMARSRPLPRRSAAAEVSFRLPSTRARRAGKPIYGATARSATSRARKYTNKVIPLAEIGTDRERMLSWTKAAAKKRTATCTRWASTARRWSSRSLRLRVPAARRHLAARAVSAPRHGADPARFAQRRREAAGQFHRGYDVFDPVKVGWQNPSRRRVGPRGELHQPYFLFDTRRRGEGNGGISTARSCRRKRRSSSSNT